MNLHWRLNMKLFSNYCPQGQQWTKLRTIPYSIKDYQHTKGALSPLVCLSSSTIYRTMRTKDKLFFQPKFYSFFADLVSQPFTANSKEKAGVLLCPLPFHISSNPSFEGLYTYVGGGNSPLLLLFTEVASI